VYADFDRLGRPGDPSYVTGPGSRGTETQGQGHGQGDPNQALVPWTDVYRDFQQVAQDAIDHSYVPVGVRDYVRGYFTSLDQAMEDQQ